jgi:hypothetical protein
MKRGTRVQNKNSTWSFVPSDVPIGENGTIIRHAFYGFYKVRWDCGIKSRVYLADLRLIPGKGKVGFFERLFI